MKIKKLNNQELFEHNLRNLKQLNTFVAVSPFISSLRNEMMS